MTTETLEQIQEIADRGLQDRLPPDKRELFDEMVGRGMVQMTLQKSPSDLPTDPSVQAPSVEAPSVQGQQMQIPEGGLEALQNQYNNNPDIQAGLDGYNQILREQGLLGELIPNVDNVSGLDKAIGLSQSLPIRAGLSFDDTTAEEDARLEQKFGPKGERALEGGFFRDAKGTAFVNPEGLVYGGYEDNRGDDERLDADGNERPFRLDEVGLMPSVGDVADVSSDAIDIGVPVAVSIMSGGSGIPATFQRAYNVMRASGLTKGLEESIEQLAGTNQQSAGEVIKNIRNYTIETGVLELGGSAINSIFRRVLTGPKTTREKLSSKTLKEIWGDVKNGEFNIAITKLPKNIQEEVVKGVTRGLERGKGKIDKGYRAVGGVVGGVKEGLKKSVTNTKVNFAPVGEIKQTASAKKQRLTNDIRALGGKPKVDRATDAPLVGYTQSFTDMVTNNATKRSAINAKAILKKKSELEREVGGGKRNVNAKQTIKQAQKKAERAIKLEGRSAIKSEKSVKEDLQRADVAIDRAIGSYIGKLKTSIGSVGNAGQNLKEGLKRAKDTFSTRARDFATGIDKIISDKPIIYMSNTRNAINSILEKGIKKADGSTIQIRGEGKQWLESVANQGNKRQTFKSMTEFLSEMTSSAYNPNLVGDITAVHSNAIKQAIMKDMENAVLGGMNTKRAINEWMRFRTWYKHQVRKFDDASIRDLTKDVRAGGIEPSQIVSRIQGFKSVEQVAKIKRAVRNPEIWNQVKREALQVQIANATTKGGFDPASFYRGIKALDGEGKKGVGRVFTAIFDKDAKVIMGLAEQLSKKNQVFKLPIKDANKEIQEIGLEEFKKAMIDKLNVIAVKENKFQGKEGLDNIIKSISKGDDDVAQFFMQKGKRMDIRRARDFYGKDSKEWKAIQYESAKKVLGQIIQHSEDPLERFLVGDHLLKHLRPMKNEIVEMFGDVTYRKWVNFAEMSANVSKNIEGKKKGGMIAGASIALHPMRNLTKVGQLNLMGKLFLSGTGLDYFTQGFKSGLGSGFSRKLGTLTTKTSLQTLGVWFQQWMNKTITDNRDEFKADFPDSFDKNKIKEFINLGGE